MLKIVDNHLQMIVDIFESKYPDKDCRVFFSDGLAVEDCYGYINFPDDKDCPEIYINAHLPFERCLDVLSHELAHLAVGEDCNDDHGPEWEKEFDWIHSEFCKRMGSECEE